MGSTLEFQACIRRPEPWPAGYIRKAFQKVRSRGLRFGGHYRDQSVKEDPPTVFSVRGSSSWESDFETALEVSEKQGWGWIAYEFDLQDDDGRPEPLDFAIRPHPESNDGRWLVAELSVGVSHVHSEVEMNPFLESIVIPTLRELKPILAVGDVLEDYPYLPSVAELEGATPSEVCWFNLYGPPAVIAIGEERLKGLQGLPGLRVDWLEDGGAVVVLQPLPLPDSRCYVKGRLMLGQRRNPEGEVTKLS